MTRHFLDACFPAGFVSGFDGYLSYSDGLCAFQPNPGNYPVQYVISSIADPSAGIIGDCEPGNPPPSDWVTWVQARRAAGADPTIYVADDTLGAFFNGYHWWDVRKAFQNAGVPEPHYWIAKPAASAIPAGAVAVQTNLAGPYDVSIVADYWPGIDALTPPVEELGMNPFLVKVASNGEIWFAGNGAYFYISNLPDLQAVETAFPGIAQIVGVTDDFHNHLLASATLTGTGAFTGTLKFP
jgi:hypothetical protein